MKEWNDMNKAYVITLIVLLLGIPIILIATGNPIFLIPCLFWVPLFTLLLIESDDEDPDYMREREKRDMRWSNYPIGYDSEERKYRPISRRCDEGDNGGLYDE